MEYHGFRSVREYESECARSTSRSAARSHD